jgi:hypothetical protein
LSSRAELVLILNHDPADAKPLSRQGLDSLRPQSDEDRFVAVAGGPAAVLLSLRSGGYHWAEQSRRGQDTRSAVTGRLSSCSSPGARAVAPPTD